MPTCSIIVTLYNYEKYIQECLYSIINQSFKDYELIVVDDASTDNGAHIASAIIATAEIDGMVYIQDENKGYAQAKNYGIRKSTGKYLVFLDADDILTPKSIESRLAIFKSNSKVDFVHGIALRWYPGEGTRGYNKKTYCHAQGRMYKRELHEKYGLYYDMRSMSDKEWVYRLGVHNLSQLPKLCKDVKIKNIVAWYRKHETQMHRVRKKNEEYNKKLKKQFKRRIKQLTYEGITKKNTEFL